MIIQSPNKLKSVFLAGGITGCENWQSVATCLLENDIYENLVIYNPRRATDLAKTGSEAEAQIYWEFEYLNKADIILFWFPKSETMQPISLFELGCALKDKTKIFVGAEDGYPRKFDLEVQLKKLRGIKLYHSLHDLCGAVIYRLS